MVAKAERFFFIMSTKYPKVGIGKSCFCEESFPGENRSWNFGPVPRRTAFADCISQIALRGESSDRWIFLILKALFTTPKSRKVSCGNGKSRFSPGRLFRRSWYSRALRHLSWFHRFAVLSGNASFSWKDVSFKRYISFISGTGKSSD